LNKIFVKENEIRIKFGGRNFDTILFKVKTIPSVRWTPSIKSWILPLNDECCYNVLRTFPNLDFSIQRSIFDSGKEHEKKLEWINNIHDLDYRNFDYESSNFPFKTSPFNHQIVGIDFLNNLKNVLLLDEMGLGKTLVVLYSIITRDIKKVLVLCPNSLKFIWAREIELHTDENYVVSVPSNVNIKKMAFRMMESLPRIKLCHYKDLHDQNVRFHIINYESFIRLFELTEGKKKAKLKGELADYDMVVCDEIQRIKSYKTKTFKCVKTLSYVPNRIGLTGTPIVNNLIDIYNIGRFVNPYKFGESFYKFANKFLDRDYWGSTEGYRNLNEFKDKLSEFSIRRLKVDCLDLPEKLYTYFYVDMTKEQRKVYNELMLEGYTQIKEGGKAKVVTNTLTAIQHLSQCADGIHIFDESISLDKSAKVLELDKIIEDQISEHKMVIWTRFVTNHIEKLAERYSQYNPVLFYGAVSTEARDEAIHKFQTDPTCRLFIGNPQAGGLGITITAADMVIFFDKPMSPAMVNQAADRVHRIGQDKNVTIISLIANGTVDERIEEILTRKMNLARLVLDEDELKIDKLSLEDLLYIFGEEIEEE